MWALTRNLFPVAFEWGRLARFVLVAGGIAAAGELLLPTDGVVGFITRALALAAIPPALYAARFFRPGRARPPRGACSGARGAVSRRLNSSAASRRPFAAARGAASR